jgi:hypothetical protein
MREEAERIVAEQGWSKAALGSMHKIDSFIRESQRLTGSGPSTRLDHCFARILDSSDHSPDAAKGTRQARIHLL